MRTASIYSTMLAENIPKAIIWLLEYMHSVLANSYMYVCQIAMVHGNLKKKLYMIIVHTCMQLLNAITLSRPVLGLWKTSIFL